MTFTVVSSCKQNGSAQCSKCNTPSNIDITATIDTSLGGGTLLAKVWYVKEANRYDYADGVKFFNTSFGIFQQSIESGLFCKEDAGRTVISYVLYLDGQVHLTKLLKREDIKAVGIYSIKDDTLFHRLYVKEPSGRFNETSELNAVVDGIEINLIHQIKNEVIKPSGAATSFLIADPVKFHLVNKVRSSEDQLPHKLSRYKK